MRLCRTYALGAATICLGLVSSVAAASTDAASRCDVLAAWELDYSRVAPSVDDDDIELSPAEIACRLAVEENPAKPRYLFQLGRVLLQQGNPVAFEFLEKASGLNYAAADYMLALDLADRAPTTGSEDLSDTAIVVAAALPYFENAVDKGHQMAQFVLGAAYFQGVGVPKDVPRALELFERAVLQENALAANALGMTYFRGEVVDKDVRRAASLFEIGANGNVASSQFFLGGMLLQGIGVTEDRASGLGWIDRAAARGYRNAIIRLGVIHRDGDYVPRD